MGDEWNKTWCLFFLKLPIGVLWPDTTIVKTSCSSDFSQFFSVRCTSHSPSCSFACCFGQCYSIVSFFIIILEQCSSINTVLWMFKCFKLQSTIQLELEKLLPLDFCLKLSPAKLWQCNRCAGLFSQGLCPADQSVVHSVYKYHNTQPSDDDLSHI